MPVGNTGVSATAARQILTAGTSFHDAQQLSPAGLVGGLDPMKKTRFEVPGSCVTKQHTWIDILHDRVTRSVSPFSDADSAMQRLFSQGVQEWSANYSDGQQCAE